MKTAGGREGKKREKNKGSVRNRVKRLDTCQDKVNGITHTELGIMDFQNAQ